MHCADASANLQMNWVTHERVVPTPRTASCSCSLEPGELCWKLSKTAIFLSRLSCSGTIHSFSLGNCRLWLPGFRVPPPAWPAWVRGAWIPHTHTVHAVEVPADYDSVIRPRAVCRWSALSRDGAGSDARFLRTECFLVCAFPVLRVVFSSRVSLALSVAYMTVDLRRLVMHLSDMIRTTCYRRPVTQLTWRAKNCPKSDPQAVDCMPLAVI